MTQIPSTQLSLAVAIVAAVAVAFAAAIAAAIGVIIAAANNPIICAPQKIPGYFYDQKPL